MNESVKNESKLDNFAFLSYNYFFFFYFFSIYFFLIPFSFWGRDSHDSMHYLEPYPVNGISFTYCISLFKCGNWTIRCVLIFIIQPYNALPMTAPSIKRLLFPFCFGRLVGRPVKNKVRIYYESYRKSMGKYPVILISHKLVPI